MSISGEIFFRTGCQFGVPGAHTHPKNTQVLPPVAFATSSPGRFSLAFEVGREKSGKSALGDEVGAFALSFFVPTPGDLTARESRPPGICHPRQKNANARGQQGGGGGGLGEAGTD